jgi:hypothetical protein
VDVLKLRIPKELQKQIITGEMKGIRKREKPGKT